MARVVQRRATAVAEPVHTRPKSDPEIKGTGLCGWCITGDHGTCLAKRSAFICTCESC